MTGRQPTGTSRSSGVPTDGGCQLDQRIEEVARRLLGEPNRALSSRTQLRFGRNGSVAVEIVGEKRGQWYDHENKRGGSALDLIVDCTGLSRQEAVAWAAETFGIDWPMQKWIAATYNYCDERGSLLFQVVRYTPKTFRQRRPDGSGGWSWRVKGVRQVPYRLPELLAERDAPMFVVEGEKDADRLAHLGLVATCNAGGANKWPASLNQHFHGRRVYVLPDNDAAGRSHAEMVAAGLRGIASSVRIVVLPNLPPGGDVSDWLDADGNTPEVLRALCEATPLWQPEVADGAPSAAADPALVPYCDEALTLTFSARHADRLRYCDAFGRWFEWDSGRWQEDLRRRVFSHARQLCRDRSLDALDRLDGEKAVKVASAVASARTVAAVVGLARADARHATAPEDWDADAWTLNTPAGLVDLRSGRIHPHDRDALCSKITAVAPSYTRCPRWQRFLDEITAGDAELQAFLGRVAGYVLTGSTREHALFFLYGTGANGKGTFLNTLTGILGDYARIAGMDTFTETSSDRHPTELAMLRGARLVTAQETDEGRRWAESRIKALTGGDPITARFMRQDFFTYTPQFKLLIAGNHKPGLRNIVTLLPDYGPAGSSVMRRQP